MNELKKSKLALHRLLKIVAEESVHRADLDQEDSYLDQANYKNEKLYQNKLQQDLHRLGMNYQDHLDQELDEESDEESDKPSATDDLFADLQAKIDKKKSAQGNDKKDVDKTKSSKPAAKLDTDWDAEDEDDDAADVDQQSDPNNDSDEQDDESDFLGSIDEFDPENIQFADIRDKLNTIRAGRSLRDKSIRDNLKQYIAGLSDAEKVALFAFLDGVGKILTAGLPADDVSDPSEPPANVEMHRAGSKDKSKESDKEDVVDSKPTKLKPKRMGDDSDDEDDDEDTAPPINVGSKQKMEALRQKVRHLMAG